MIRRTVAAFCFLVTMCSVASGQSGLSAAWEELHVDPAPTHRQGHLFIAGQDRLFVFGGNDGARVVNDFWAFDPVGVGWAYLELPEDVAFLNLAEGMAYDGRLYIIGQYPGRISPSGSTTSDYLDALLVYDIEDGIWEQTLAANAPLDRVGGAFVDIGDGRALLFGGSRATSAGWAKLNETWVFDATERRWEAYSTANPPPPRSIPAIGSDGSGNVLVFGGLDESDNSLDDTWLLTCEDREWIHVTPAVSPTPRHAALMASVGSGLFLLLGGRRNEEYLEDMWVFRSADRTWQEIEPGGWRPDSRVTGGLPVFADDAVYLFGGGNEEYLYNDVWRLRVWISER